MAVAPARTLDVGPGDDEAVAQVEQWFRDYKETRDPAVRERIILAHLGLADRLAARFGFLGNHGVASEDLVQAARVGLVAAVDRYDPGRANPFIVYAIACINGELRRCLRDTSWRVPTLAEIGAHLGANEEQVAEAMKAIDTRRQLSPDQPIDEKGTTSFGALLPAPASEVELEDRLALPALMSGLSELERRAVIMRFFQDLKQTQIGAELGYSQMHVSRVLRRPLAQMREQLAP